MTNLREYVTHNPPGVTFFLCLLALALSFICLSSYSYTHSLPNPDTVKDWNHLLSSLSQYHLCVKNNTGSTQLVPTVPSSEKQNLYLQVPLIVTSNSDSSPRKDISLHTRFTASELQLDGNDNFTVTIDFMEENDSFVCLTINASTQLLSISPLPPTCSRSGKNIQAVHCQTSKELTTSQTCYSLQSRNDPAFRVMLTKQDQLVAVQHLLEVSVVLLGVCLILCISVSLTYSVRRHHWKGHLVFGLLIIQPLFLIVITKYLVFIYTGNRFGVQTLRLTRSW